MKDFREKFSATRKNYIEIEKSILIFTATS
jgi:hypothetical protein